MRTKLLLSIVLTAAMAAGCQKPVNFNVQSLSSVAASNNSTGAFDTNSDGKADFFTFSDEKDPTHRIHRIAYSRDNSGKPDEKIDLDTIPFDQCRHVVVILDGFGYEVLKKYQDAGGLRFFHAPSRVIAPYPSMTDLALQDVFFRSVPGTKCRSFEALYYEGGSGKIAGGSMDYLSCKNEPFKDLIQYRVTGLGDAMGYLHPWDSYVKEVDGLKRAYDANKTRELIAYIVSSAAVGTRQGAEGQRQSLEYLEKFLYQVMYESHGKVKFTLFSDHGHSYTQATRIPLEDYLARTGWKVGNSVRGDSDVALVKFGLLTCAYMGTRQPAKLAADLLPLEGIEVVSYRDGDSVMVAVQDKGMARITQKNGRYKYEPTKGDPLSLKDILAKLRPDADGFYDEGELFAATESHHYPDPLERLYRAHTSVAQNIPDLIVSLKDNFYFGSTTFAGTGDIASTHGALNARNSTAFVMTSMGTLPPYMTSRQVAPNLAKAIGVKEWPIRK